MLGSSALAAAWMRPGGANPEGWFPSEPWITGFGPDCRLAALFRCTAPNSASMSLRS